MAKAKKKPIEKETSAPKFPYATSPSELKNILRLIPKKPKPPKLVTSTANTWGIKNTGVGRTLGVLREIGLIDASGVPTADYVAYMTEGTGGLALGKKIKERYNELFDHFTQPQNASSSDLKNFFNIHSGGVEKTIEYQISTFKALSEFASFDDTYTPPSSLGVATNARGDAAARSASPQIHFDLHIHLPEGKNTSDYESIIRAISDYIVIKIKGN